MQLAALESIAFEADITLEIVTEGSDAFYPDTLSSGTLATAILSTELDPDLEPTRVMYLGGPNGPSEAITKFDQAIKLVFDERSKLGAIHNRLEHTIANLSIAAENLQAAESRIRDLEMAEEMMTFTKNNVLQQAATAMLAQANLAPQAMLQLLG